MRGKIDVFAAFAAALACAWIEAAPAEAARPEWIIEEDGEHREIGLSALGGVYFTGFGGEGRMSIPVAPTGAIDGLNESFAIEFGAGYQYFVEPKPGFSRVTFPLMVRWDFHLTPLWTVYGAVGAAGGLPLGRSDPAMFGYHGYVWWITSIGAFLHLGSGAALRMEIGSLGLLVGFSWA